MKFNSYSELKDFFDTVPRSENVVRDEDGRLISFSFEKRYKNGNHKKITASLRKGRKDVAMYLPELDFFEQLYNHVADVQNIKIKGEKICGYMLNGKRYKTDKPIGSNALFNMLDYRDFMAVTKHRFYGVDTLLRNGYFSGLIGTDNWGIWKYMCNKEKYDLYDIDFNAAYPYCLRLALPCGRFYNEKEWEIEREKHVTFMCFYEIKIKCLLNPFGIYVPPPPRVEYADFDFLLPNEHDNMIVSEYRLGLIRQVYGSDAFTIRKKYYCATKKYVKLAKFAQELYERIKKAKADNDFLLAGSLKIALNSLIGNFGRRDETRSVLRLEAYDSNICSGCIKVVYSPATYKRQNNYLPLAMVVNDITARRLLNLMTANKHVLRLCYNTDGGIVAIERGYDVVVSDSMGRLKAKKIKNPRFYSTSLLYARPLIIDLENDEVYNSKAIYYDKINNRFLMDEMIKLNTRRGFEAYVNTFPVPVEDWGWFNLREREVIMKLRHSDIYKRITKVNRNTYDDFMQSDYKEDFYRLTHPFDGTVNVVKHVPAVPDWIEYKQVLFDEKFFKNIK